MDSWCNCLSIFELYTFRKVLANCLKRTHMSTATSGLWFLNPQMLQHTATLNISMRPITCLSLFSLTSAASSILTKNRGRLFLCSGLAGTAVTKRTTRGLSLAVTCNVYFE